MKYYIFESGSKGNCTLISSKGRCLLIDAGISKRKLVSKLQETGFNFEDINHVLVTHSHTDHVGHLDIFNKEQIYATKATYPEIGITNELIPFNTYTINGFKVFVVPLSHDADGTVGYVISDEEETLVYITDTGYIYEKVIEQIKGADYYIFESNHNVRMLIETDRPISLIKRIMGDYGHLSNIDSANYLCDIISKNTKEIVLAHLSQEANSVEQCLKDVFAVFKKRGLNVEDYNIRCASQVDTVSGGKDAED